MRVIKFRVWDCELKEMIYDAQDESGYESDGFTDFLHQESRYKVMQFTGLLDKSGKEIWEGDLIRSIMNGQPIISEVFWVDDNAGFCNPSYDQPEVIGNIYENGDLLK